MSASTLDLDQSTDPTKRSDLGPTRQPDQQEGAAIGSSKGPSAATECGFGHIGEHDEQVSQIDLATLLATCLGAVSPVVAEVEKTKVQQAVEAYLFGYPMVTFDMVRQQNTNVSVSGPEQAPMGQLIKMRSYPAVDNHCCAAPNADTLYTMAWFDLSTEPWLVTTPELGD